MLSPLPCQRKFAVIALRLGLLVLTAIVAQELVVAGTAWADDAPAKPAPAKPAPAYPADPAKRYEACMALAKSNPTDGWEASLTWMGEGGGEPARHCGAVALIGLKQYREAADRLEDMARESHDEPGLRADMLAQAAQAWILEGDFSRAYADQTTALQLTPGATDLLIDRAESLALAKNWRDALIDLDRAIANAPNRADAHTYRATARRALGDLKGATDDATRAVSLDPNSPDAWLEYGDVARLDGDAARARQAWMTVLRLAPKTPLGDAARLNLEKLDVKE